MFMMFQISIQLIEIKKSVEKLMEKFYFVGFVIFF